jgi:hypothetical protein
MLPAGRPFFPPFVALEFSSMLLFYTCIHFHISSHLQGGGIKRSELPLVFSYTYSATQRSLTQAQQAAQLQAAQKTHQQMVDRVKKGDEAPAATAATSASTSPAASAASFSSSSSSPSIAAGHPKFDASSDWMTGANFQPVLNTVRHNFVEAFGLPITRLYSYVLHTHAR